MAVNEAHLTELSLGARKPVRRPIEESGARGSVDDLATDGAKPDAVLVHCHQARVRGASRSPAGKYVPLPTPIRDQRGTAAWSGRRRALGHLARTKLVEGEGEGDVGRGRLRVGNQLCGDPNLAVAAVCSIREGTPRAVSSGIGGPRRRPPRGVDPFYVCWQPQSQAVARWQHDLAILDHVDCVRLVSPRHLQ